MAVSTTNRKAGPFVGNDATTVFPFTFKVFDAEDLLVVLTDDVLVENTLILDTDYTVVLNGDQDDDPGGSVTLTDALETGTLLTITSQVEPTQTVVLTSQGGFYPSVINRALDKLTIIAQQLVETVGRTIRLPLSSTASGELPSPMPNALLGWNGTGTGFSNVNIADLVTAGAYGTARVETFEGNGTQIDFDLANGPGTIANVLVFIGGVAQVPGADFSLVSSQRIRFVQAPFNGAAIQVRYATGGALPAQDDLARSDGSNVVPAAFLAAIGGASTALLASAAGAAMIGVAGGGNIQTIIDGNAIMADGRPDIVGDGVADDTAGIQRLFDEALAQRRGVRLGRKRYRCTDNLTFRPTGWNPLAIGGITAFAPSIDLSGESPLSTVLAFEVADGKAGLVVETGIEPQFTLTANLTNGSAILAGIADTSQVVVGSAVSGTNISGTVLSKTSTTVTVSANANASVTGQTVTFSIFRAAAFGSIRNLCLSRVSGANATGLRIRSSYNTLVERVAIIGFANGFRFKVEDGDFDGSVYSTFRDVWVQGAVRWGADMECSPGKNELSFVLFQNVWFQDCGNPAETFKAVPNPSLGDDPQSGAVIFKGQNFLWQGGGWTVCHSVGFYQKGDSGLGCDAILVGLSAENTGPRQVLSTGGQGLTLDRVHFQNNNSYPATVLAETWGLILPCNGVVYRNCRVRMTDAAAVGGAGQPLTAFKNTRPASTSPEQIPQIDDLIWQSFGYAGQVGFSGDWNFGGIPTQAYLSFSGQTVTILPDPIVGGTVPLAIRAGNASGLNFETGHVVPHIVRTAGYSLDTTAFGNGIFNAHVADDLNTVKLVSGPPNAPSLVHGVMRRGDITGYVYVGRFGRSGGSLLTGAAANWLNPTWVTGGWSWVNSAGKAMIKAAPVATYASLPSSDTDGVVVGTQT